MKNIENYVEKLQAGWLGKLIGIRYGAPIEGWTAQRIEKIYGELDHYLVDYKDFAADDDSNGPIFFLRALEDYTHTTSITPQEIGLTWLNYAPYEHGFYWWGGYGISTEHTAYINLRNGVLAPESGSIKLNGSSVAEQIGGQIFIDTWGLICPGKPELAAIYAEKAASVSHDGNGIYGAIFIATCIAEAFVEKDIKKIIEKGLSFIPNDCEYKIMTKDVMRAYYKNPNNWRKTFEFVEQNYGYDKYEGNCHIIPNSAVIILALMHCEDSFEKAINISNMCGWDTDCNVANVGSIIGVKNGLEDIDYEKWVRPINDLLICSSVIGSLNQMDVPWSIAYIGNLAYKIANEKPPEKWVNFIENKCAKFNFDLKNSTHSFRLKKGENQWEKSFVRWTDKKVLNGNGALQIYAKTDRNNDEVTLFHKTYYRPKDLHDSRYDPSFSPILYTGETISCVLQVDESIDYIIKACLYVKDLNNNKIIKSDYFEIFNSKWTKLSFKIPPSKDSLIGEMGVMFVTGEDKDILVYMDNFHTSGKASYGINFAKEQIEIWQGFHREVSQFTYLKGLWDIKDGALWGSCGDFGEAYTGRLDFKNYKFSAKVIPQVGFNHQLNFRVQGAIRSYGLRLFQNNKLKIVKNNNGYVDLVEIDFPWEFEKEYDFDILVNDNNIKIFCQDKQILIYEDLVNPYLFGAVGGGVYNGSRCCFKDFYVEIFENEK